MFKLVFIVLILFNNMLVFSCLAKIFFKNRKKIILDEFSVIIPLVDWDNCIIDSIKNLLSSDKCLEVIIVVDSDHNKIEELKAIDGLRIVYPVRKSISDKVGRLYYGVKSAIFENIVIMDSDVKITKEFIRKRFYKSPALKAFEYSLVFYDDRKNIGEKIHSNIVNYLNLNIYLPLIIFKNMRTAIAPCISIMGSKNDYLSLLEKMRDDSLTIYADDHLTGKYLADAGYYGSISNIPVIINEEGKSFSARLDQISRWFFCGRKIADYIEKKYLVMLCLNCMLKFAISVFYLLMIAYSGFGYFFLFFIDGIAFIIQKKILNRKMRIGIADFFVFPISLLVLIYCIINSFRKKQFSYRSLKVGDSV